MIDAFFNVNKPAGISSRAVVDAVARAVGTKRVGHAGTLDPMATGVLVVAVGKATRLVEYVQRLPKTYEAEFELGAASDTDDATGTVHRREVSRPPDAATVQRLLGEFVGAIEQRPPAVSAVKVKGRRAYQLARSGVEVAIPARPVVVHAIDAVAYDFPRFACRIVCGSGTYVRSIGRDLGERLGIGAMMTKLCRTAIGGFQISDSAPISVFDKAVASKEDSAAIWRSFALPLALGLTELPTATLDESCEKAFHLGQATPVPVNTKAENAVSAWNRRGDFLGIGWIDAEACLLWPAKGGFAAKERD